LLLQYLAKKLKKPSSPFASINSSTSGARTQKELPVGKHAIQLYSLGTPNGKKVTILLEELAVAYDAWLIDISKGDQFTSGFVKLNPNSKIPTMLDQEGPDGPLAVFESGSILFYLAEKYDKEGKFLPQDPKLRTETITWLFFNIGAAPYFGQFGHFYK
jgi:GST-like protein